ncbi:MAG: hypothetical protein QOF51_224 [Chloroflexota bacterium]|nr:hypothetical protein [Chloroflexota bacterium]
MSIKVGLAPGQWAWAGGGLAFLRFVDACEELGFDSLWLSDRVVSPQMSLEPLTALAAAAARTRHLKLGTSVLALAIRNPVLLAKELATIDFIAAGRLFPAVGLGGEDDREYEAAGVRKVERAGRTDEAIGLLRRLWSEDGVTHQGRFYTLTNVTIRPRPSASLPIWIGGRSAPAWRRVARLGDGWLASSVTPDEVAQGIAAIRAELPVHARHIEDDHYGVMLSVYVAASAEAAQSRAFAPAGRLRTDVPVDSYAALGSPDDINRRVGEYVAAGASKFVLRLACPEAEAHDQLARLAESVLAPLNASVHA